jgi:hypothetical protein
MLIAVTITCAAASRGVAGIQPTADEAREICLGGVAGKAPIDDAIRVSQTRARSLPTKPDGWVRVGWDWVRKARLSGDPGFYVNVASCADARAAAKDGNRTASTRTNTPWSNT